MKVAVTSEGNSLESDIDFRFGKCHYLILVDLKTMELTSVCNEENDESCGGLPLARFLAREGVKTLITGHVGPNAFRILSDEKIKILKGDVRIKVVLEKLKKGELHEISSPSVDNHIER